MKKTIFITVIVTLLVVSVIYGINLSKPQTLSGWLPSGEVLIGSASNLKTVPLSAVFAASTTTAPTGEYEMLDGGATLDQEINTSGIDSVKLFVMAKGDTATSTLFIRQMASHDGSNFFDIASSTESLIGATSTISVVDALLSIQYDPGLATTSKVFEFPTRGYKFTRFIIWGENITTDDTDGVQAFINAVKVDPVYR